LASVDRLHTQELYSSQLGKWCLSTGIKLILHAFDKVLCPSRRGDHSISYRLAQFVPGSTGMLRDREVLG